MQIFGLAGWSAVFAGGLKTMELPPDVRNVIIAADNDVSGAGQRNALAAYDRWVAEDRSVRIKCPPNAGDDFNDVLIKRCTDARH
jgi:putative DNA primase/helicase